MLSAMETRDPSYDGRFITGVLSTGIYCLPSCKARNPKPENVRFFPTPEKARRAGLRACLRCRPDAFYSGEDEDRNRVSTLVDEARRDPSRFPNVEALIRHSALGSSKLHELFRLYFQTTPAALLQEARIEAAGRRLLATADAVAQVAFDVGYESLSSFNENFRRRMALSPMAYRRLEGANAFTLRLPADFCLKETLGHIGRDPESRVVKRRGRAFREGLWLTGGPGVVEVDLKADQIQVRLEAPGPLAAGDAALTHRWVLRRLGLVWEPSPFERLVRDDSRLGPLVARRPGLRLPLTGTAEDALFWAIVGQQVNLGFAYRLLNRLVERAGAPAVGELWAPPRAAVLADWEPAELQQVQFSRSKAEYVVAASRQVAGGELNFETLAAGPAPVAEEKLRAVRGIGPWTARYILMRGLGFADCVPVGDAGLVRGLMLLYGLDQRPGPEQTEALMEPFRPYRSLATFHLWSSLEDAA
jgi:AraC family transcriptional regulator of adaptative response / DNA-3-methyladenine glycosylase II